MVKFLWNLIIFGGCFDSQPDSLALQSLG